MSALDARALKQLDWYFDVISPFAYLAHTQLTALTPHAQIRYVPVVFAGLLQHFGNVGPAEIAPKRQWTFEHCAWTAHTLGVPFNPPAAHPFNPIPLLRAIVAAGSTSAAVSAAFEYVWVLGGDVGDSAAIASCAPFRLLAMNGVLIPPGQMTLTRTPWACTSLRKLSDMPSTANFEA